MIVIIIVRRAKLVRVELVKVVIMGGCKHKNENRQTVNKPTHNAGDN